MKEFISDYDQMRALFDAVDLFNGYLCWQMMKNDVLVFSFEDAFKICYKIGNEEIDFEEKFDIDYVFEHEQEIASNTL